MTPADLSRLESLAREATPETWRIVPSRPDQVVTEDGGAVADVYGDRFGGQDSVRAAYIAAANPAAVLALIARVRELEGKPLTMEGFTDADIAAFKETTDG